MEPCDSSRHKNCPISFSQIWQCRNFCVVIQCIQIHWCLKKHSNCKLRMKLWSDWYMYILSIQIFMQSIIVYNFFFQYTNAAIIEMEACIKAAEVLIKQRVCTDHRYITELDGKQGAWVRSDQWYQAPGKLCAIHPVRHDVFYNYLIIQEWKSLRGSHCFKKWQGSWKNHYSIVTSSDFSFWGWHKWNTVALYGTHYIE